MSARCLETRRTTEGHKLRRHEDGTVTIEVPRELFEALSGCKVKQQPRRKRDSAGVDLQAAWR